MIVPRPVAVFSSLLVGGVPSMEVSTFDGIGEKSSTAIVATTAQDVLSTEDLVVGAIMAVGLAFTASFLQGRRSQNDFVLWEKQDDGSKPATTLEGGNNTTVVFGADSWKEMSQPDNYILYNRRLNERERLKKPDTSFRVEKTWILITLLALFVPIFSVEFFFALSRQVICGDLSSQSELSQTLCAPANLLDTTF